MPTSGMGFIKNAIIHPYSGAILDNSYNFLKLSAFLPEKAEKIVAQSRYIFTKRSTLAAVIGHGSWDNYYHWYIDSVPRVFGLQTLKNQRAPIDLYIAKKLLPEEKALLKNLVPGNVRIRFVNKFTLVKADKGIFLPFLSKSCSGLLPADYLHFYRKNVFNTFKIGGKKSGIKIFISRKYADKRKFLRQEQVDQLFHANGFLCLYLEKISMREQIAYFYNATVVIGTHGAGLTNLLYSSDCKVIEIFHCSNSDLNHYRDLALSLKLSYHAVYLRGVDKDSEVELPLEIIQSMINNLK